MPKKTWLKKEIQITQTDIEQYIKYKERESKAPANQILSLAEYCLGEVGIAAQAGYKVIFKGNIKGEDDSIYTNIDFSGIKFDRTKITETVFENCTFGKGSHLKDVIMNKSSFQECHFKEGSKLENIKRVSNYSFGWDGFKNGGLSIGYAMLLISGNPIGFAMGALLTVFDGIPRTIALFKGREYLNLYERVQDKFSQKSQNDDNTIFDKCNFNAVKIEKLHMKEHEMKSSKFEGINEVDDRSVVETKETGLVIRSNKSKPMADTVRQSSSSSSSIPAAPAFTSSNVPPPPPGDAPDLSAPSSNVPPPPPGGAPDASALLSSSGASGPRKSGGMLEELKGVKLKKTAIGNKKPDPIAKAAADAAKNKEGGPALRVLEEQLDKLQREEKSLTISIAQKTDKLKTEEKYVSENKSKVDNELKAIIDVKEGKESKETYIFTPEQRALHVKSETKFKDLTREEKGLANSFKSTLNREVNNLKKSENIISTLTGASRDSIKALKDQLPEVRAKIAELEPKVAAAKMRDDKLKVEGKESEAAAAPFSAKLKPSAHKAVASAPSSSHAKKAADSIAAAAGEGKGA
jgi:hypothetical protein